MIIDLVFLVAGLIMILIAAEVFTNGIEGFGRKFGLSQAVVGSLLAAVGTALPETILPLVALFFYSGKASADIAVGAILGAPFMLGTLALFLIGLTIVISFFKKRRRFELRIEAESMKRDLVFFLSMYTSAIVVSFFHVGYTNEIVGLLLIGGYVVYAYRTFRGESAEIEHAEAVYLEKLLRRVHIVKGEGMPLLPMLLQVVGSLSLMIWGAHTFVQSLEHVSVRFGMNPLLFALLLAPIATELPEKFNSVTWTWKGRDTLAVGNITGAMVFQSTFPVSVGLFFTEWQITGMALFSAIIAITAAVLVLGELLLRRKISPLTLLSCGGLYLLYAFVLVLQRTT